MRNLPSKKDAENVILYHESLKGVTKTALAQKYNLPRTTLTDRIKKGEILKESLTYDEAVYVLEVSTPERPKFFKEAIQEIYQHATSVAGIQQSTELNILSSYGLNWNEDKKYVRKQVRKQATQDGVEALFVPTWLYSDSESPREIRDGLMVLANELHQRIDEMVNEFIDMHEIDPASDKELRSILVRLVNDGMGGTPVSVMCNRLDNLVNSLDHAEMIPALKRKYRNTMQVIDLSLFQPKPFNYNESISVPY